MRSRWKGVERGRSILGQVVRDPHRKGVKGRVEGRSREVGCGWEWEGRGAEGRRGLKQSRPVQLVSKLKRSVLWSRGEVLASFRVSRVWGGANGVRGGAN